MSDLWKPLDIMGAAQRDRDTLEFAAYRRGLAAALRLLERETPLAVGSIAAVRRLHDSLLPKPRRRGRPSDELPLEGC